MPDGSGRGPAGGFEHFNAESSTAPWRRRLKASEPGRIAAAVHRRRRVPLQLVRGARPFAWSRPRPTRRRVHTVIWIPAGPGSIDDVVAAWESAVASSPGRVALLVTDDWMSRADRARLLATVPEAVVVRPRWPTGGPPRLWPVTALAIAAAAAHFDFEHLVKFDTDALAVGPGWVEGVAAAIAAAQTAPPVAKPEADSSTPIGIAGAFVDRPDGGSEVDAPYHRRVLAGERPHDRQLAAWHRDALDGGWPEGEIVQGGCLVLTRGCCEAIASIGGLAYRPRLRTIVSEDLLLTVLAYATGFRAASIGGPAGPLAVANKHLPVPLGELADPATRWLVAHSVRRGLADEPEVAVRAALLRGREHWPAR